MVTMATVKAVYRLAGRQRQELLMSTVAFGVNVYGEGGWNTRQHRMSERYPPQRKST
ncbi:MAG: hypothetical protein NZ772_18630 [Cyanobacteria bacterium]|nr:hypothetical protein [Cyanobacteriota bacterium]